MYTLSLRDAQNSSRLGMTKERETYRKLRKQDQLLGTSAATRVSLERNIWAKVQIFLFICIW
jgi:tRNA nucleotidyltransferase/poly(A) polymerase